jgi:hypothetical protein
MGMGGFGWEIFIIFVFEEYYVGRVKEIIWEINKNL